MPHTGYIYEHISKLNSRKYLLPYKEEGYSMYVLEDPSRFILASFKNNPLKGLDRYVI
jgi:hypothetical protein